MFTLHLNAQPETTPRAIIKLDTPAGEDPKYTTDFLSGKWKRVFPQTGKDVAFLRMLSHQADKFAPATGGGVLIRADLLSK